MEQQWVRDSFSGPHEIGGMRTFEFLDQWLKPQLDSTRFSNSNPVIEHPLGNQPLRDTFRGAAQPLFGRIRLSLSRGAAASPVVVRYGSQSGARDLGEVRLQPAALYPQTCWYDDGVAPQTLAPGRRYHVEVRTTQGDTGIYGPRPLDAPPRLDASPFA